MDRRHTTGIQRDLCIASRGKNYYSVAKCCAVEFITVICCVQKTTVINLIDLQRVHTWHCPMQAKFRRSRAVRALLESLRRQEVSSRSFRTCRQRVCREITLFVTR